jgi:hypothetical protein
MSLVSRTLLIAAIAFAAALAGVYVGQQIFRAPEPGAELHDLLHEQLQLDPGQHARIEELENRFAVRRRALELELRADNARLADAIAAEHGNGPAVAAAIERSHHVMGELQKETLAHMFAMRRLLHPDQAAKFDRAIMKALTQEAR